MTGCARPPRSSVPPPGALRPAELERIRTKSLLSRLFEAGGQLRDVDLEALDPGQPTILRAKEAWWSPRRGTWSLTPEGRRFLDDVTSQHDSRHWDRFVEGRLVESLLVTCPTCGAVLAGHWLRPILGCLSCHHRFPIHESPAVTIHDCYLRLLHRGLES